MIRSRFCRSSWSMLFPSSSSSRCGELSIESMSSSSSLAWFWDARLWIERLKLSDVGIFIWNSSFGSRSLVDHLRLVAFTSSCSSTKNQRLGTLTSALFLNWIFSSRFGESTEFLLLESRSFWPNGSGLSFLIVVGYAMKQNNSMIAYLSFTCSSWDTFGKIILSSSGNSKWLIWTASESSRLTAGSIKLGVFILSTCWTSLVRLRVVGGDFRVL